jgi:hypothetical protein
MLCPVRGIGEYSGTIILDNTAALDARLRGHDKPNKKVTFKHTHFWQVVVSAGGSQRGVFSRNLTP